MKSLCFFILMLAGFNGTGARAKAIEGVEFAEKMTVNEQDLVLNGVALRTKKKLGINFRVYVAGLYAKQKINDGAKVISSRDLRVIKLVFLRSVDKGAIQEAWVDAFNSNCKKDCEASKKLLGQYNELMVDMKDKSAMELTFEGESVKVKISGKQNSSGTLIGQPFAENLMSIFLGDQPPSPEFKKGLLGGA